MEDVGGQATAFPVLAITFNPRIRGIRRDFKVRIMPWGGRRWLVAADVEKACGWHHRSLAHRRQQALSGDAWGYATVPTLSGPQLAVLIAKDALCTMLKGAKGWQARRFKLWLDGLPDVVEHALYEGGAYSCSQKMIERHPVGSSSSERLTTTVRTHFAQVFL